VLNLWATCKSNRKILASLPFVALVPKQRRRHRFEEHLWGRKGSSEVGSAVAHRDDWKLYYVEVGVGEPSIKEATCSRRGEERPLGRGG